MTRDSLTWLALALSISPACSTDSNHQSEAKMTTPRTSELNDPELTKRIDAAVSAYVTKEKSWPRTAYQIEPRRKTPDGASIIVDVLHTDDTTPSPSGGAGKSFQLYLDASTLAVEKVLHFQ